VEPLDLERLVAVAALDPVDRAELELLRNTRGTRVVFGSIAWQIRNSIPELPGVIRLADFLGAVLLSELRDDSRGRHHKLAIERVNFPSVVDTEVELAQARIVAADNVVEVLQQDRASRPEHCKVHIDNRHTVVEIRLGKDLHHQPLALGKPNADTVGHFVEVNTLDPQLEPRTSRGRNPAHHTAGAGSRRDSSSAVDDVVVDSGATTAVLIRANEPLVPPGEDVLCKLAPMPPPAIPLRAERQQTGINVLPE
jgi:hypothetical protein